MCTGTPEAPFAFSNHGGDRTCGVGHGVGSSGALGALVDSDGPFPTAGIRVMSIHQKDVGKRRTMWECIRNCEARQRQQGEEGAPPPCIVTADLFGFKVVPKTQFALTADTS